jgi:hypothetical protein
MKTMIKFLSALTLAGLFSFLTGCTPCYYAPNAQNVPLFTEYGQGTGTFSFQFGPLSTGCNVQGALAIADHVGIMGNYNHYSGRESSGTWNGEDYTSNFKSNMGEIGAGYFQTFKDKFVFEAYGGLGGSRINSEYERWDSDGSSSVGTTSFFIQPSMGLYKKNVMVAFSTRFRILSFRDVQFDKGLGSGPESELIDLDNMPAKGFFEPAFTFRAGGEKVKFQAQIGLSILMSQDYIFEYDPLNINFGVVFCYPGKRHQKQCSK